MFSQYEYFGLAALLFVLFGTSSSLRYYAKIIFFVVGSIIAAQFAVPWFFIRPRDYRNAL